MILPLASGHADGKLPGDSTLCTSYPTPTRKSQPRFATPEVAESPLCREALAVPTARNPASSPAHPLAPPNALKSPESSWTHNSKTFTSCPKFRTPSPMSLQKTPICHLLWTSLGRSSCGSLFCVEDSPPPSLASTYHSLQPLFTYLLPPKTGFQEGMVLCPPLFLTPSSRPGHTGSQLNLYYRLNRWEDGWLDGRLNGEMG